MEDGKTLDGISIYEQIGVGKFATVHRGIKDPQTSSVAIKLFKPDLTSLEEFSNQAKFHAKVNGHPSIIELYLQKDHGQLKDSIYGIKLVKALVLQLAHNGQLWRYIHTPLPIEICRRYMHSLVSAVKWMHDKNVCHLDLIPENILLNTKGNLKICDFGRANQTGIPLKPTQANIEKCYKAPQILGNKEFEGRKADVFSLGVLLFNMITGSPPFEAASQTGLYFALASADPKKNQKFWTFFTKKLKSSRPNIEQIFNSDFKMLIKGMLHNKPEERFTIDQVLESSWIKGQQASDQQLMDEISTRRTAIIQHQLYLQSLGNGISRTIQCPKQMENFQIDKSSITFAPLDTHPDDLKLECPVGWILSKLNAVLVNRQSNQKGLVLLPNEHQDYTINIRSPIIQIDLQHRIYEQPSHSKMFITLYKTKNQGILLRFQRDRQSMDLSLYYELLRVIRDNLTC